MLKLMGGNMRIGTEWRAARRREVLAKCLKIATLVISDRGLRGLIETNPRWLDFHSQKSNKCRSRSTTRDRDRLLACFSCRRGLLFVAMSGPELENRMARQLV